MKDVQINAVRKALRDTHAQSDAEIESALRRLLPSLFKHDFEMLLLAAKEQLRTVIGTTDSLGGWREVVEEQDLDRPPKRVVEELFRTKSKRRKSYLATRDAPAVLRRVSDVRTILKSSSGQCTCPEFVSVLMWLGEKLGEQCLELD